MLAYIPYMDPMGIYIYTSTMSHGKSSPVLWYFFDLHHGADPAPRPGGASMPIGRHCSGMAVSRHSSARRGLPVWRGTPATEGAGWKRVGSAEVAKWILNGGKWWEMRSYTCFRCTLFLAK